MFTGIVEEVGVVREAVPHRLAVGAAKVLSDLTVSDSIVVNGVCLTVVEVTDGSFAMDLSEETLQRTNLGGLGSGDPVNLERAVAVGARMGGHTVQGHVDGVGEVLELVGPPESRILRVAASESVSRYLVEKAYIAVDGISLTVTSLEGLVFSVAVIPYTLAETNLRVRKSGDFVNLEVDILAKYVEQQFQLKE
jgi:riboflavin synthase